MRLLVFILLACSLCACGHEEFSESNNGLTEKLDQIQQNSGLPGFTIVAVNDHSVLYQQSFGYADIQSQTPYTDNTVQNIGSISKTFIALALMKAVDQGKLKLDDDINLYLPFRVVNPHHPEIAISIRQLTNHTSSIVDSDVYWKSYVLLNPDEIAYEGLSDTMKEDVDNMKNSTLIDDAQYFENVLSEKGKWYSKDSFSESEPGKQESYSNIASALAAFVIQNATRMNYEDYTRKYIFKPLTMTQSGWDNTDYNQESFATRYYPENEVVPSYHLITAADGGIRTTSNDFAKYMQEMLKGAKGTGTIVKQESYQEMLQLNAKENENENEKNGIFWDIKNDGSFGHSGADPGILTVVKIHPEKNVGYYFMTNISADLDVGLITSLKEILKILKHHSWLENK